MAVPERSVLYLAYVSPCSMQISTGLGFSVQGLGFRDIGYNPKP